MSGRMNEPKEQPIIFTAESIRAILEDRKIQTRRTKGLDDVNSYQGELMYCGLLQSDQYLPQDLKNDFQRNPSQYHNFVGETENIRQSGDHTMSVCEINPILVKCPYGSPGDRLWVKETWGIDPNDYGYSEDQRKLFVDYRATDEILQPDGSYIVGGKCHWGWNSPIYMPRWASRIDLEITGLRAERVQDITIDDLYAEGCPALSSDADASELYEWFVDLWDSINGKHHPWSKNEYVWVIEFKRIE